MCYFSLTQVIALYISTGARTCPRASSFGMAIPEAIGRGTRWWWIRPTTIQRLGRSGEFVSDNATVAERFIFDPSGDRFTYDATYTDPTVLTRPFTITIPNRRVTDKTPADDWNNLTFPAKHAGNDPIIEAYERVCVEGNGNHGQVVTTSK
jgi:hypothetical protein